MAGMNISWLSWWGADGETANEARARAGLADWPGEIIFLTGADTKL